jgi:hypothetical protein
VAFPEGAPDLAADLTPYCLWQTCERCRREELFYLTRRRRSRSDYFSFATGHGTKVRAGGVPARAPSPAGLGMAPLGSRKHAAAAGWRSSWADLATRRRRLLARVVDLAVVAVAALVALLLRRLGLPGWWTLGAGALLAAAYEPVAVLRGGTLGKRLLRIEPVSVWDGRPLGRGDALRRAGLVDAQLFVPPLAVRSLAWLLWDPARQCLHDRHAHCVVTDGRTGPGQPR